MSGAHDLRLFELALVLVRFDYGISRIVNADRYSVWGSAAPSPEGEFSLAISSVRFQFSDPPTSKLQLLEFQFVLLSGGDVLASRAISIALA